MPNVGETVRTTLSIADLLGRMLWEGNMPSVIYRYNLTSTPEEAKYRRDLAAYRFHHYPGLRLSAVSSGFRLPQLPVLRMR